jgi:hypothetical protein
VAPEPPSPGIGRPPQRSAMAPPAITTANVRNAGAVLSAAVSRLLRSSDAARATSTPATLQRTGRSKSRRDAMVSHSSLGSGRAELREAICLGC